MREKSKKVLEVEKFVDSYIKKNGAPPTYDLIAKTFDIAKTSAYSRCAKIRDKMKSSFGTTTILKLKIDVPNDKFEQVTNLVGQIYKLLRE